MQPPFVAAPIEGRGLRVGVGLGVAGALLAVCCGLGVVAGGGLLVLFERVLNEQAQTVVDDYLAAVADQQWEEAYRQRCDADRRAESLAQFTDRVSGQPRIASYEIGDLRVEPGDDAFDTGRMAVPVDVAYRDGTDTVLEVPVEQSPQTGQLEVCGRLAPA